MTKKIDIKSKMSPVNPKKFTFSRMYCKITAVPESVDFCLDYLPIVQHWGADTLTGKLMWVEALGP